MKIKVIVYLILACSLLFSTTSYAQEAMVSELNRANSVLSDAIVLSDGSLVCLGGDSVGGPPDNSWLTRFSTDGQVLWEINAKEDQSFASVLLNFSDTPCFIFYDKTKGVNVLCLVNEAGEIETSTDLPRYGYGNVVHGNIWIIGYEGNEMYISCYDKTANLLWEMKLSAKDETATLKESEDGAVLMMTNQSGHATRFVEINTDGKEVAHTNCDLNLIADDFIIEDDFYIVLTHGLNETKEYGTPYLVELSRKTAHEQAKRELGIKPSDELYNIYPNGTGFLFAGNHYDENGIDAPVILLYTDDKGEVQNAVSFPHFNLSHGFAVVANEKGFILVGTNRDAQSATAIAYANIAK